MSGQPEKLLEWWRPIVRRRFEKRYDLHERGSGHVPDEGPFILAPNHIGYLDGPVVAACAPRPVHALTKSEMFIGHTGRFLRAMGQIPIDRDRQDVGAVRAAVDCLNAGQGLVVFPEGTRGAGEFELVHPGVAWLSLVTGAPVVPVALLGTRLPGGGVGSKPPKGARIDLVYGKPFVPGAEPFPRTNDRVAEVSEALTTHLRDHLAWAQKVAVNVMPGPLPEGSDG